MRLGKHVSIFQAGTEWSRLRALYDRAHPRATMADAEASSATARSNP